MAFKMKLGSKNLDGLYSINNKQTDAIKSGSGGLGIAGQVPDGPGSQGEAMANKNDDGGIYQREGRGGNINQSEIDKENAPREFDYGDGKNEVKGTLNTKDREVSIPEYKPGNKQMEPGMKAQQSNVYRGGETADLEITDTGRNKQGRKAAGRTGNVRVLKKKGDITF